MEVLVDSLIIEVGINVSEKHKDSVNERNTSYV